MMIIIIIKSNSISDGKQGGKTYTSTVFTQNGEEQRAALQKPTTDCQSRLTALLLPIQVAFQPP